MDKFLIRKDVYEDLIEKGYGQRDLSKLTKKQITDKNGHKRTVYVRNGEQPAAQNQGKAQDELSPEKKAHYEEMLEKVKTGSEENALFVRGKGMLNKKDAIAHLSEKLGKKPVNSAYEGHLESDNPPNTDITKEDEERFGKQALSGLSGKRTSSEETKNETPHGYILNKLTDEEKNKIYDLFKDADFTKQLDSKLEFHLDDKAGEMILKKMPHGALQSKIYELAREYNRENFKDARDYKNGLPEEAMGQLYKDYKENLKNKPSQDDMKENEISFEDSVKEYNFTDTKKNQFAMNEVANFYPELKDIVENRRKAFYEVDAAEKKLKVNPNNKEYKDNFASAYNKLKQADEEYDKASKKALEKAPDIKKPDFSKYMDAKRDVQKFLDKYKQQSEEYEVGQRLRNNGGAAILSPMYGLKPDDYTKDPNYIKAQMIIRAYEEK